MNLSVREITPRDIPFLCSYWLENDADFMIGMGVDLAKIPTKEQWKAMLEEQLVSSYREKKSWCLIWEADGKPVGHSNINKIVFGEEAYMHLHMWNDSNRQKGAGTELVKMSLPWFFSTYELKKLFCEPYALNPAPNHTLPKAGFEFVKRYTCVPGWINFEQEVNLWEMSLEKFRSLQ